MKKLKILIVEDEKLIRWSLEKHLESQGFEVTGAESGEEGLKIFEKVRPQIVFTDNKLPGIQGLEVISRIKAMDEDAAVIFMTAYGSIDTAVNAMKAGASEYVNKPFSFEEIDVILENIRKKLEISREVQVMRRQQKNVVTFDDIIGESPAIAGMKQLAGKIAETPATTILLLGESGTGKDFFARAIHNASPQSGRPFVTINCSALSETLLESELFGHEKGAFTDARQQKKGLFEIADGGTVFMDEIGEINASLQIKLLGVLENRVIRRVGGTAEIPVDIRIIAATNKDLKKAVEEKVFREDLFYRLKVFQLTLPPLREHPEDIPLLTDHFIKIYNQQFKKRIRGVNPRSLDLLTLYRWPGNIRELRNVIERAVILETSDVLQTENLPAEIMHPPVNGNLVISGENLQPPVLRPSSFLFPDEGLSLEELEKEVIRLAMSKACNNQTHAARLLGISRDTLRYKVKKHDL